ncbi:hypothetical protein ACE193_09875 [Bernardetia sp. OM2101]|uniref:hypothetical protein n=1 Tax=Bernardetia sp. OM2101 TaxID=3344876 RepID=UPI0035D0F2ED
MKKYNSIWFAIITCFLMISCGGQEPTLTPSEVYDEKWNNHFVYLEGEVSLPDEQSGGFLTQNINVTHENGEIYPLINVEIGDGTVPHEIKPLPAEYTDDDFYILDKNKQVIKVGDKIRIRVLVFHEDTKEESYVVANEFEKL